MTMSCSSCSSQTNNEHDCNHDCSSCSETCSSRETEHECSHDCSSCSENCAPPKVNQNVYSNIKHVIGVVSGKAASARAW